MLRLVASLLLLLLAAVSTSHAQRSAMDFPPDGTIIRELRIEGTNRISPAVIERAMELKQGRQFTRDSYRRDLQSIANIGRFDPLQTRITWESVDDGIILTTTVRENPVIRTINIVGNVRFTQRQILNELGYEIGDVQPTGVRASTIRNLNSFYRNGGFKDVRVRVEVRPNADEPEAVDININIDERGRIRIADVILRGNTHFNSFLATNRLTNAPGILFFRNYYDESAVEDDIAQLRVLYEGAGFLDARVRRGDFIYDEARQRITLVYDIEEGPRYRISEVATEGVTYFTQAEIRPEVERLEGRVFNGNRLGKALTKVRRLYGDQGYIDTEVGYRVDKNTADRTARLILTVRESGIAYVGEVRLDMEEYDYDIDTNVFDKFLSWFAPATKPEALMREVRLKTGEKFRSTDQVRTQERLRNLGIFRRVEVRPVPTADPDVRDAVITIEEDPAAAFVGATAGIGEFSGPALTLSLVQPNMGGEANRLSASVTFGTRTTAFRISYFDRYLGDSDVSLETSIYRVSERYQAYRQRSTGASTEFGKPLGEYTTGYLRFRGERVQFSNTSDDAIEEDFDDYWVFTARPLVIHDRRDNRFFPTQGYLASGGVEIGAADGFLLQFLHGFEWYHQFDRSDLVYAYRHGVGLSPFDATEIGLGERFFLGGSSSLRGFRARGVGPVDRGDDDLHLGGATRLTQTHELRYPFNDIVKGRIFTDIGILERDAFELGRPRIGSGVGVMLDLGALSVEVDLAVPLLKESTDRRQFLHLRIGSRF
jgi:outer membrane protein insertion porin family